MDKKAKNKPPANTTPAKAASIPLQGVKQYPVKFLCLVLAVISFAVYANTLQNGYVLDDMTVVTKNTIVAKGLAGIPDLLTTPRLTGFEGVTDKESYRPVPLITHAIEYQVFGPNAAEGHLMNILLFAACVIVLFIFLNRLFGHERTTVAFIAALLFAVHPIHTEVVANIKSRDEIVCFLFAFLSLNLFVGYAGDGKLKQLLAGGSLLLLSLLSKETAISFVLVVPVIFFFYLNNDRKRSLLITIASIVAVAGFFAARAAVIGIHHTNTIYFLSNPLLSAPGASTRFATALYVLGSYLKLLVVPYPLICDYSYNSIPFVGFDNVFVILSLITYLALTFAAVYRLVKFRKDQWAFGVVFFLITIALFSNIPFLVYSEMAERFLFFASAGFCFAVALVVEHFLYRSLSVTALLKSKKALLTLLPICIVLSGLTIARNADWKDNYTLFTTDLKRSPNDCELYYYVATEISHNQYAEEPNPANKLQLDKESIDYLNKAVAIYPGFDGAHVELGRIYEQLQMYDSAVVHDSIALKINPTYVIAAYNLGRAYYFLKRYPEAIDNFKKTIAMQPDIVFANLNLACCYSDYKEYDSAIVYFNRTLTLEPTQQIAKQGMAFAESMKSKQDTAGKK